MQTVTTANVKATAFQQFLESNQITCFAVQEAADEAHTVIFRTQLEVGGQQLPVMLITDDSLYTLLQVRVVAAAVKGANGPVLLDYVNTQNRTYKAFKYYLSETNDLVLDSCLPAVPEQFEPQLVSLSLDIILRHLTEEYPALMRIIWAGETAAGSV
ncbi:YbjN domain-containing protein [Pelosinus propionicus]|uniref:Putative sensory transduction regulator n=1 Tax=Pelosinus propionicus DSM 13327 TaxID=1123291 RepID=A0A1I4MCH0_9FIRM|nr:YbjN domain-containing protein [Pelosinus propionicus]SFM00647.1 Putative sensory transduction regulator [Pelosinus propionicus DSM 13327]